jgi:hypothetical protein
MRLSGAVMKQGQDEPFETPLTGAAKQVATPIADVLGGFLRVTLLQLARLHRDVALLQGKPPSEALKDATTFIHDLASLKEMLEAEGFDWQEFEKDLRAAIRRSPVT